MKRCSMKGCRRRLNKYASKCDRCFQREYMRQYRKIHPENVRKAQERWRRKPGSKEKIQEHQRKYRRTNGRARDLRKYGLTIEQFEFMLKKQGGRCAICRRRPKKGKKLHVDHDHKTGKVRALLCHLCNMLVGFMENHPRLLKLVTQYLYRFSHKMR